MIAAPVLACAAGLGVSLAGEATARPPLRAVGKVAASAAFLAWGWSLGLLDAGPHGTAMMVGLALSAVGDVALLWTDRKVFLAGIGAFLMAHVAYAVAFVLIGVEPLGVGIAAVPLAGLAAVVWRWLGPHVGRLRSPVLAYVAAISVMVALAAGVAVQGGTARTTLLAGAVLFFASDLFVARHRFVAPSPVNRFVGLPLYYVAQLVLAYAAAQLTS